MPLSRRNSKLWIFYGQRDDVELGVIIMANIFQGYNIGTVLRVSRAFSFNPHITLLSKVFDILTPTTKMNKMTLKGEMTYSRSHS